MERQVEINRTSIELPPVTRAVPLVIAGFLFVRMASLISMPLEGLRGYGDFIHFFNLASLEGWPFFDYWVEFPPIFAFTAAGLYRLSGGQEHVFDYQLYFLLTLADAGNLLLFARLAGQVHTGQGAWLRVGAYLAVLVGVPYSWWYFDPLAVFFTLFGINAILSANSSRAGGLRAGFAIAAGILTKLFPGLVLVVGWRRLTLKKGVVLVCFTLLPVALVWGALWLASPDFTAASLSAQSSKGSWETVWALLDGNLRTGNFGTLDERLTASTAFRPMGSPAVIPTWLTIVPFGLLGLAGLWRTRPQTARHSLALLGFAWCLFLLWSPGWSPQWVLYVLPLILLVLIERQALLFALMLVLVNLLEWPVLLSRGMFYALPLTIVLRTLLLALLAFVFYKAAQEKVV